MVFPIITKNKQIKYEKAATNNTVPEICGYFGRACRQMGKTEGANRFLCNGCSLAAFCKEN